MSRIWPPEMVATVKRRWAAGDTAAVIAAALPGKSRAAVLGLLDRKGLLHTKPPRIKSQVPCPRLVAFQPMAEVPPGAVPLLALTFRHCRWPLGALQEPTYFFCGADSVEGLAYCPDHCAVAFAAPSPRVRQPWRARRLRHG